MEAVVEVVVEDVVMFVFMLVISCCLYEPVVTVLHAHDPALLASQGTRAL